MDQKCMNPTFKRDHFWSTNILTSRTYIHINETVSICMRNHKKLKNIIHKNIVRINNHKGITTFILINEAFFIYISSRTQITMSISIHRNVVGILDHTKPMTSSTSTNVLKISIR